MPLREKTSQLLEQREGKKIVFTNGCFDILHRGHVTYLKEAKRLGDFLIIGLNSDSSVKKLKGPQRPVFSQEDRAMLLEALAFVDAVEIFSEETPLLLIQEIVPDILTKGGDYTLGHVVGRGFVESQGGVVKILPLVSGYSTSRIVAKIQRL